MAISGSNDNAGLQSGLIMFDGRAARLMVPDGAKTAVIFAHGTGSDHQSPRNCHVADRLQAKGHATLLIDLLCPKDKSDELASFDPYLQAGRILDAVRWVHDQPGMADANIGLFGAGSGAGGTLIAAGRAGVHDRVAAIVCRGGRPDLADQWLAAVDCPTLLIVGEKDSTVLGLNREAMKQLTCPCKLDVIPHAGRLFDAPGHIEQVADITDNWFGEYLRL